MSERRVLLWIRLLVGLGLLYQGWRYTAEMHQQAALFASTPDWQGWPLVGGMRPLELTLWLALLQFFLGVFIFGGLLTRVLALVAATITTLQLATLGVAAGLLGPFLLLGSAVTLLRGGGAGTMDAVLGTMQRRSIEREAARQAERTATRERGVPGSRFQAPRG